MTPARRRRVIRAIAEKRPVIFGTIRVAFRGDGSMYWWHTAIGPAANEKYKLI